VPVSLRDARNYPEGRRWIESVFPDYLEDLSDIGEKTSMFPVKGDYGDREPDMLARWFRDDRAYPLLILKDNQPAGFAVVNRPLPTTRAPLDFHMAEFFVSPHQRRLGVGRDAVTLIFKRFAGKWEVTESHTNKGAVAFWRNVVQQLFKGHYKERIENGEIHQYFDSTALQGK
jgi:predicted acetyltransferase